MLRDTSFQGAAELAAPPEIVTPAKVAPVDLAKINTLHELLALALDDFEKVLGDKAYGIDVGACYHVPAGKPYSDGWEDITPHRCTVCVAGAVIAMSLGGDRAAELFPASYDIEVGARLDAVDQLRLGSIEDAWSALHNRDLSEAPDSALCLQEVWEDRLAPVCSANNRTVGRRLLSKLRIMQRELKDAGL